MLAVGVLNETIRTDTLQRSDKNGRALRWHCMKPDWKLFERSLFYVKRDEGGDWRMRYQHTEQYHQSVDDPFETNDYSYLGEWRGGLLTDIDLKWRGQQILSAVKTVSLVPALSENEIEKINELLVLDQVTESNAGSSENYQQLIDIAASDATPRVEQDVRRSDIENVRATVTRLNEFKVRRLQARQRN